MLEHSHYYENAKSAIHSNEMKFFRLDTAQKLWINVGLRKKNGQIGLTANIS